MVGVGLFLVGRADAFLCQVADCGGDLTVRLREEIALLWLVTFLVTNWLVGLFVLAPGIISSVFGTAVILFCRRCGVVFVGWTSS